MQRSITVLLVERECLFRRGLAACLDGDHRIRVVASVGLARDALATAAERRPDIAIVGVSLLDLPGIGPIVELRRRLPALKIIALGDRATSDVVLGALDAGARKFISKDISEDQLLQTVIRVAHEGPLSESPRLMPRTASLQMIRQIRDHTTTNGFAPVGSPLTCRELEILRNISTGMTNAEVGPALGISPQTVKNHMTAILRKLGVGDRTEAVVHALRRGWLSIQEAGIEPPPPAMPTTAWSVMPRH
ncbi:MAG: response regulator transcription factor [Chloroflexota bacterium]|nr:response regulator transcription factor [Chloroflexota bacterium]